VRLNHRAAKHRARKGVSPDVHASVRRGPESARRGPPVLKSLGRRLLWIVPIILIVTFFVFALLDLAPGDAARTVAGTDADPAPPRPPGGTPATSSTWTSPCSLDTSSGSPAPPTAISGRHW